MKFKILVLFATLTCASFESKTLESKTLHAEKEIILTINEDKVIEAIDILKAMEDATFTHQEDCEFKDTEYCTCDGDYLALIEYNRINFAKQLLCDAIEAEEGE